MAPGLTEDTPLAATMDPTVKPGMNNSTPAIPRHEEHQYLDLVREIMETGEHRPDR